MRLDLAVAELRAAGLVAEGQRLVVATGLGQGGQDRRVDRRLGLAVLALFSIGVGALSFALATVSAGQDWIFWTVQQTLIFPLLLLAGVLLPLDGAPGWLRFLADLNPLGYIIDAERALFSGTFPADTIAYGALAAAGVAALGLVVGLRTMRRSS